MDEAKVVAKARIIKAGIRIPIKTTSFFAQEINTSGSIPYIGGIFGANTGFLQEIPDCSACSLPSGIAKTETEIKAGNGRWRYVQPVANTVTAVINTCIRIAAGSPCAANAFADGEFKHVSELHPAIIVSNRKGGAIISRKHIRVDGTNSETPIISRTCVFH